jgi:YkoY family integral membrane protein
MWGLTAADFGLISGAILTLVFLEGLLSADNALVLAVMVRHLPKEQQKRALRYGIFGAFFFRFIAVVFASMLLEYWIVKVVGGLYLLYLAISHLAFGEGEHGGTTKSRFGSGFWGTVIGVELADIAFSIDSILAAVALANGLPPALGGRVLLILPALNMPITMELLIVYIGGILGIIAMRFVAGYFLKLLDRFAGLAVGAYYLVAWIGLKLVGSGLHNALHPPAGVPPAAWLGRVPGWVLRIPLEMSDWLFWTGMGVIVVASFLIKPKQSPTETPVEQPLSESEILA